MRQAGRRPWIRSKHCGFSLVELLFAMVLVSILLWPFINHFIVMSRGSLKTGDLMIGVNLCSQVLEIVKNKPFKNLLPDNDPLLSPKMNEPALRALVAKTIGYEGTNFQYFNDRFKRELTITPLDPVKTMRGEEPKFVQLVIHCGWISRDGKSNGEITLCSLVANEGARIIDE